MKYDVKRQNLRFSQICYWSVCLKEFSKKTFDVCKTDNWTNKSDFKILELLVITFGTGRYRNVARVL